jgi:hypothetical protein
MSELEQMREQVDDPVNKVRELMEKWDKRITLDNLRLVERYLKGELEVHILLRLSVESGQAGEFAAILTYFEPIARAEQDRSSKCRDIAPGECSANQTGIPCLVKGGINDSHSHDGQPTVFVDIVKFVENPEVLVPTIVWLECLYDAYSARGNSLYFSKRLGFVFGASLADHKGDLPQSPLRQLVKSGTFLGNLPDQMVESAAQVMDGIAKSQQEPIRNRGDDFGPKDLVSRLRVIMDSDFVWAAIEKVPNLTIEIADVMFGPFDFKPNLGEPL